MKIKSLILSLPLLFSITACQSNGIKLSRLTKPNIDKIATSIEYKISQLAYDSYTSFAKKFAKLMINLNTSNEDVSVAVSIPDAYLCFAISAIIASDEAKKDILDFLELTYDNELKIVTRDIIKVLCTLYKNQEGQLVGGYNLNSIWLNPLKVALKEKDKQLYKDLEEIFDASIFYEALTSEKANKYLLDYSIMDMPTPKITLNDDDPDAVDVMSTYYCLDYFDKEERDVFYNQYKSQNHKMDYFYNNQSTQVDYIETNRLSNVYEGENFIGTKLHMNLLNMNFFLPNDKNASPKSIMGDVLNNNYHTKTYDMNFYHEVVETSYYNVNLKAPYFYLDNELTLDHNNLLNILPIISTHGACEKIAYSPYGDLFLDYIKQFSIMRFNYDGFYSCSVTVAGYDATSTGLDYQDYQINLDHPYLFNVTRSFQSIDKTTLEIPLIIGQIITPDYK